MMPSTSSRSGGTSSPWWSWITRSRCPKSRRVSPSRSVPVESLCSKTRMAMGGKARGLGLGVWGERSYNVSILQSRAKTQVALATCSPQATRLKPQASGLKPFTSVVPQHDRGVVAIEVILRERDAAGELQRPVDPRHRVEAAGGRQRLVGPALVRAIGQEIEHHA